MSFLVAVRPASAFSLKKPFFSSRVRARASLVVSLGTATLILSSFGSGERQPQRMRRAGSGGACGGGRAAAGGQGSGSSGHAGNFQKITTSDHRHFVFPLYFYKNVFVRCGTIRTLCTGSKIKKRFRPQRAYAHKDESVKLPWYHLGLLYPHRDSLNCCGVLSTRQPDAVTGAPVAGLALLHFAPAAPRPFSVPCFLPFSTARALWKDQCENLLFSSQPFL